MPRYALVPGMAESVILDSRTSLFDRDGLREGVAATNTRLEGLVTAGVLTVADPDDEPEAVSQLEPVAALSGSSSLVALESDGDQRAISAGHTIYDEATPLAQRGKLVFTGAGVVVADDSGDGETVVTIPGGGGEGDISVHAADTTDVHGIPDTADLVYTDDARLSDDRDPTAHTHATSEVTGLDAALATIPDLPIAQADVTGLTTDLAAKLDDSQRGTANGVASLDSNGRIPYTEMPLLPVNQQGGDYTFALADRGTMFEGTNAGGTQTGTIPPNSSVAFPVGALVPGRRAGTGTLIIAPGSGVTLRGPGRWTSGSWQLAAQGSQFTLHQRAANDWVIAGDVVAV